ncbi:MAG: AAA family ATPase [Roseburia sp.]|nr:AAA family ATPase [Roseburia sp.]
MEIKNPRILLAGPSGVGKTTVAKFISEEYDFQFISGSVSDLLPQTKDMLHADMLARDSKELYMEDFQILNLRNQRFRNIYPFVSDRSFLDSAAYFIYKQADKIPPCEIEHFLELAKMATLQNSDYLIFFEYTMDMFNNWVIEDNLKRVTSKYFQMEISRIMTMVLDIWGVKWSHTNIDSLHYRNPDTVMGRIFGEYFTLENGIKVGELENLYGKTKVIVIREANKQVRERIIDIVLNNGKL